MLDGLREMAGINTLFVATFTYGRGIGGRQPRDNPLPDHGKQEYDDNYRGGNFATPHPELYRKTSIVPEKAPNHAGYDVLADVISAAHRRRMKVIAWFEDVFRADGPGLKDALEVDVHGKPGGRPCFRNPNTREFWLALVEDHLRFNEGLDGLVWSSERQGPVNDAIGASHGAGARPSTAGCFCPHCLEAARREGINRSDGAFVTNEVLAWERLWNEGLRDTYRAMHAKAIGWHIWHGNSFAEFYRAELDYQAFGQYSDFLKVAMCNICGEPSARPRPLTSGAGS